MPYRVYVVEDHPVMREAYAHLLGREAELEVCGMAASAEEALEAFDGAAPDEPPCDLIVADFQLPGMDGIEMVARVLARHPGLVAIVVSAFEEEVYERRARAAGAAAFLGKRDLGATLLPAIREALQMGRPSDA